MGGVYGPLLPGPFVLLSVPGSGPTSFWSVPFEELLAQARDAGGDSRQTRIARAGLQAMPEAALWARLYRKHAARCERREHLLRGIEAAYGATSALKP